MSSSPGPRPAKRRKFERTRWLYQKDGRDLGPFTPDEIFDLLKKREIGADTMVRESAGTEFRPVKAVEGFAPILAQVQAHAARAHRERELDKAENRVRSGRKAPRMIMMMVGVALLAAGGWYGWTLLQNRTAVSGSGYADSLFRPLELNRLAPMAFVRAKSGVDWADEQVNVREAVDKKVGGSRGRTAEQPMVGSADDLAGTVAAPSEVQEVSFDGDSQGTKRTLSAAEVASVNKRAMPKLIACAQAEAERASNFPGTTVRFSVEPSGRMGRIQLGKNGARSKAFSSCVRGALRKIKVKPFDPLGANASRTITVPLRVGR